MSPQLRSFSSSSSLPAVQNNDLQTSSPSSSNPNIVLTYPAPAATTASLARSRSGSLRQPDSSFSPPNIGSFLPSAPHVPFSSSTHAGGIQPSASFFFPSRPSHATRPRPASIGSETSGSLGRTSLTDEFYRQALTRPKVSRDPLLPIGGTSSSSSPRKSSVSRPGLGQGQSSAAGSSRVSSGTGGRVRSSLEKIIRRTLSIDSHSYPKPKTTLIEANTIELHPPDEDHLDFKPSDLENDTRVMMMQYGSPSSTLGRSQAFSPQQHRPRTATAARRPDLSAVPLRDPTSRRFLRNWEKHPSRNKFFLRGRFLTGGDSPIPFMVTLTLAFGIAGGWLGTTSVWWWRNETPAVSIIGAYMCLLTIINMFATAFRDPGILPRGLDPEPPYPVGMPPEEEMRTPLPRDLRVRVGVVRVKYCTTCRIYRPPRSSHCRMCDNCVDGCDHHCQWVNNCVGRRNYTSFITLLCSAFLTLCLVICTSALQILLQIRKQHMDFDESLRAGAGSAVLFCVSLVVIWPVTGLLGYHLRLLALNLTTVEQIRISAHKTLVKGPAPANPFSVGRWRRNVAEILCRAPGLSWVDGSGVQTVDERELNPGPV